MYIYMYTYVYVYIYIYIYMCVYIYIFPRGERKISRVLKTLTRNPRPESGVESARVTSCTGAPSTTATTLTRSLSARSGNELV